MVAELWPDCDLREAFVARLDVATEVLVEGGELLLVLGDVVEHVEGIAHQPASRPRRAVINGSPLGFEEIS